MHPLEPCSSHVNFSKGKYKKPYGHIHHTYIRIYWRSTHIMVSTRDFIKSVKPTKEDPVLIILDNHESHVSIEAINKAIVI
jgi:hypothetical protein